MPPKNGLKSYYGIGFASTWGTPVARTNWLETAAINAQRVVTSQARATLGLKGAPSNVLPSDMYVASDTVTGSVDVMIAYDDSSILLMMEAMGGTGCVTESGAGPYTHTCYLGDASDDQVPLTIECGRGNEGAEVVDTALLTGFTLSISPGGLLMGSFPFIGRTTVRGSLGSPTYVSSHLVKHNHAGQCTIAGTAYDILGWRAILERGLAPRQLLGSEFTARPAAAGPTRVRWEVEVEASGDALNAAYLAGTLGTASQAFTDGARSLTFELHNARIVSAPDPVTGPGIIKRTLTLEGQSSGVANTTSGARIIAVNALATYRSNG